MSQQPPPPPPYGAPPAGPRRRKPSGWWFAVPALMLVAAVVLVVTAFVSTLGPLAQQDAVVTADGSPQTVELDDDGARLLMAPEGEPAPTCEATDASGDAVEVDAPGASYTYGNGAGSWSGFGIVEPGGDTLELTCEASASDATDVRVGPAPGGGAFPGFALMLIVGIFLGFGGVAALVLLVVLVATGAPRKG